MLSNIYLENFKAFRKLNNLEIKPVTILCGANSCGKSSILQSILLGKQTLESKKFGQVLQPNGRFTHLGMIENLVFGKKASNELVIGFSFKFSKDSYRTLKTQNYLPFRYILERIYPDKCFKADSTEFIFHYKITLKLGPRKSTKTHLKPIIVKNFNISAEAKIDNGELFKCFYVNMDLDNSNNTNRKDKYNLVWENLKSKEYKNGNCPANARFNNLIPFIAFSNKDYSNKDEVYVESLQNIRRNLIMCSEMLGSMFSSFNYIGPLREEPSRRYIYEDEIIEIGLKGENAAYICQNEGDVHLYNCYFFNAVSNSFYKIDDITLMYALKNWLENMDISGFETEPSNEIVYLNMQSSTSKDTKVNIADVGFGVSQILPILLEGLRMPENNTLILEQPEIHLHPKLQMQMADYFISLALSNKNIIVETHSDHIVNRLVRRVIEDETKNLNDLIAIYFISATDKGSSCEKIEIDDRNGIVNWPEGFFDQTANEQEKIIKAGLTKRMKKIVN